MRRAARLGRAWSVRPWAWRRVPSSRPSLVSANGPSMTGGRPAPSYRTNDPSGESAWVAHVLAGALQLGYEVAHVLHVRVDLRRRPPVHRSTGSTSTTGAGPPR